MNNNTYLTMIFLFFLQSVTAQDSPLLDAIKRNDLTAVKQLITQNADVNQTDENKATPLMWAAYKSNLNMVKYLVQQGADVQKKGVIYQEGLDGYFGGLLGIAANKGDLLMLKYLIEDCKLNPLDREYNPKENADTGWTAFEFAALSPHAEKLLNYLTGFANPLIVMTKNYKMATEENGQIVPIFSYLSIKPESINTTDDKGKTALHYACSTGNLPVIKLLIKEGADFKLEDNSGKRPLHLACQNGQYESAKLLIDQKAEINIKDKVGNTPLALAAASDHLQIVKMLYFLNGDLVIKNNQRHTAFDLSKSASKSFLSKPQPDYFQMLDLGLNERVLKNLESKEYKIELQDTAGNNLLHKAAEYGYPVLATTLISKGININGTNKKGDTPLIVAAHKNQLAVVKLLLENGADVHHTSGDKFTALQLAVKWSDLEIIRLLLQHKADINEIHPEYEVTPLIRAAHTNQPEVVKYLLENGAKVNLVSTEGVSALHASVLGYDKKGVSLIKNSMFSEGWIEEKHNLENDHFQIVQVLLQHKIQLDLKTYQGYTALDLSKAVGYDKITALLESQKKMSLPNSSKKNEIDSSRSARVILPTGHEGSINASDISSDGQCVLSGGSDKTIIIWDIKTGSELFRYVFPDNVNALSFSPDDQHFITATSNLSDNIQLWDFSLDSPQIINTLRGHSNRLTAVLFSPDGSRIYSAGWDGSIKGWDTKSGELLYSLKGNQKEIETLALSSDGKYLASGSLEHTVEVWNSHTKELLTTFRGHTDQVLALAFSPDGKYLTSTDMSGKVIEWDWKKSKAVFSYQHQRNVSTVAYSGDGKYLAFDEILLEANTKKVIRKTHRHLMNISGMAFAPNGQSLLTAGTSTGNSIKIWSTKTGSLLQELNGATEIFTTVPLSDNEVLSATLLARFPNRARLQKWNIAQGTMDMKYEAPRSQVFNSIAVSDDKELIALGQDSLNITDAGETHTEFFIEIKSIDRLDTIITRLEGHKGVIRTLAFSPDGNSLVSGGDGTLPDWGDTINASSWESVQNQLTVSESDIFMWDIHTGKLTKTFKGHTASVAQLSFSSDGKYMLSSGMDKSTRVWDVQSGEQINSVTAGMAAIFIQNNQKIATKGYFSPVAIWDFKTNDAAPIDLNTNSFVVAFGWSEAEQKLLMGTASGELFLWDAKSEKVIQTFEGHSNQIASIHYLPEQHYWLTTSQDRTMKLWAAKNALPIATYFSVGHSDWLTYVPENYYTSSKGAARKVKFAIGKNTYFFDQFDLQFNRPDLVMKQIGLANENLIKANEKAYFRRLQQKGVNAAKQKENLIPPTIDILNSDSISIESLQRTIDFEIKAEGKNTYLNSINVFINDAPVKSIDISSKKISTFKNIVPLKLSKGSNKISLFCINEQGVESLRKNFDIYYEGDNALPNLYLLAIGVSKHQDETGNLEYPAKDAQDVVNLFLEKKADYQNVFTKVLTDQNATPANIKATKKWLQNADIDDKVIVFYAGHGALDASHELFLGTYEIDLNNPSQKGISYIDVENLLANISARQKLLLLDACYAGEIGEKLTVEKISKSDKSINKVVFRGLGREYPIPDPKHKNTFDLMKTLFVDFRNNTGSVVIGGASGTQVAYEGDQWSNGAFTYCFLEGLKEKYADLDEDGIITLSELQQYLEIRVPEVTTGRQQPVMRREFIGNDWQVW